MHSAVRRKFIHAGMLALLVTGVASAGTFPDFGYQPPSDEYSGPLFRLSQNYPQTLPSGKPAFFKLLPSTPSNDYATWKPYLNAVKKYCLQGNAKTNWDVQKNPVRHWYHMPWQHYGPLGREGIHGLTKEAPIQPGQLAATQTDSGQTYAVGIYNAIGAYTIGKVWHDPQNPDPSYTSKPNSFHDGTVVCKALFADINVSHVPFLVHPVLWQGYITNSFDSTDRSVKKLALIQMDFAVRDSRVPGTGWIFGTFQYNGAVTGKSSWGNLVPVGLMWGNDPENTGNEYTNPSPTETRINPGIKESAINPGSELPPTHLGWNGRLDGPVDNPESSCMSCHMTAESPELSPLSPLFQAADKIPPIGSKEWMRWFQNEEAGVPFDKGTQSTDYSLQLAGALSNFYDWKCNQGGVFVDGGNACHQAKKLKLQMRVMQAPQNKVYPIERSPAVQELLR